LASLIGILWDADRDKKKRLLDKIAWDYKNWFGFHLPRQCANDEFYLLTRCETAIQQVANAILAELNQ